MGAVISSVQEQTEGIRVSFLHQLFFESLAQNNLYAKVANLEVANSATP
jgi:hypothetical protein